MKKRNIAWVVAVVVSVALVGVVLGVGRAGPSPSDSGLEGFKLFGTAEEIEFLDNAVVRIDTFVPGTFGGVSIKLGVPIGELDRKISFSSFLVNIDCLGGSPRIQLAVDLNGDGSSDGNAFGYMGPFPSFTGCVQQEWRVNDMTDAVQRWDTSQLAGATPGLICGSFVCTFADVVAHLNANFPSHEVLSGVLVQDAFLPAMQGFALYDDIQIGRKALG